MAHSRSKLADDLTALGVRSGDVLLMRAAARAIGQTDGKAAETLIDAALDALGPSGTLVGLSFSKNVFRFRRSPAQIFTRSAPVTSGGFAAAMVARPNAVRSLHPTSSFVAIGAQAAELLEGHGPSTESFFPMERMISLDGKMVLIGCVASSPGFSTVHRVQENLGLSTRTFLSGLFGAYYEQDGERRWFSRRDVSGCSMGFGKFYSHYVAAEKLRVGTVGDAYSAFIKCRDAYAVEYPLLKANPRFALCDRPDCISCRGTRYYNLRDVPGFALRAVLSPRRVLSKIE
jgi:aminoglycoside 3-N-acetyltransferase